MFCVTCLTRVTWHDMIRHGYFYDLARLIRLTGPIRMKCLIPVPWYEVISDVTKYRDQLWRENCLKSCLLGATHIFSHPTHHFHRNILNTLHTISTYILTPYIPVPHIYSHTLHTTSTHIFSHPIYHFNTHILNILNTISTHSDVSRHEIPWSAMFLATKKLKSCLLRHWSHDSCVITLRIMSICRST